MRRSFFVPAFSILKRIVMGETFTPSARVRFPALPFSILKRIVMGETIAQLEPDGALGTFSILKRIVMGETC